MFKFKAIIMMSLFLAACAAEYVKSGGTEEDLMSAKTNCEYKSSIAAAHYSGLAYSIRRNNFMKECMLGKGWKTK